MTLAERYELKRCGHCGEPMLATQLTPCPFLPAAHGLCAICYRPAQQVREVCPPLPKRTGRRRAAAL